MLIGIKSLNYMLLRGFFSISMDNPDQLGNSNFFTTISKKYKLQSIIAFLQFFVNNPG